MLGTETTCLLLDYSKYSFISKQEARLQYKYLFDVYINLPSNY